MITVVGDKIKDHRIGHLIKFAEGTPDSAVRNPGQALPISAAADSPLDDFARQP